MKREPEVFEDKAAFLAAQRGTRRILRKTTHEARPELPRAEAGHGDHLAALMRLSAAGWYAYQSQAGQHYFSRLDGTLGPMADTYEAAIAATEALGKAGTE